MGKVSAVIKAAARFGPVIYPVVKRLGAALRDNPELARQGQVLLDRFARARSARSRPESLRRSVGVLRGQAQRALSQAATPQEVVQVEAWLTQTDRLDGAIDLMTIHDRKRRAADANAIEARVEALFAEIFTALVDRGPEPGPEAPPLPPVQE